MKTFKDLKFNDKNLNGLPLAKMTFDNGYGVSAYDCGLGWYNCVPVTQDGEVTKSIGDIWGGSDLRQDDIEEMMSALQKLPSKEQANV